MARQDSETRLTQYTPSGDFPPRRIEEDDAEVARWFREVFGSVPPVAPDSSCTDRERALYTMSATEYVDARKAGTVTCEEYARALVKRARHYRYLNQWVYSSYDRFDLLVEQAKSLDAKAVAEGVDAIAPFFGLPIPMKGTAAVADYPSGAGCGVLSGYVPQKDSHLTQLIKERNGLIFGATNVPEFAASTQTCNRASGQTRNVYGHHLSVGGSSGGSASAVAAYMCPIAVTEDTGGSTRIPASCNQNFGFDPSRNHYRNSGNPGLTYINDQLGLNARSMDDIIFYDQALLPELAALHKDARRVAGARRQESVRIGAPSVPFVDCIAGSGLTDGPSRSINADVKGKYERAKQAMATAGFTVLAAEWPSKHFDYLGRHENVIVEAMLGAPPVSGQPLQGVARFGGVSGQMAEFVQQYLDAPVSLKEIFEDIGRCGKSHNPAGVLRLSAVVDETHFRYWLGPKTRLDCEAYNSYFEQTGADMIILPAARAATPDLADLAGGTVKTTHIAEDGVGRVERGDGNAHDVYAGLNFALKHLHIPKVLIPTGLTADGRPTAIQLWGRAVPYEQMFDDAYSARHDLGFLHLARRVADAVQAAPDLRRVDAPMIREDLGLSPTSSERDAAADPLPA